MRLKITFTLTREQERELVKRKNRAEIEAGVELSSALDLPDGVGRQLARTGYSTVVVLLRNGVYGDPSTHGYMVRLVDVTPTGFEFISPATGIARNGEGRRMRRYIVTELTRAKDAFARKHLRRMLNMFDLIERPKEIHKPRHHMNYG